MTKTALLTGVTSGIGDAVKQRLEADGWRVVGIARHLSIDAGGYEADLSILKDVEPVAIRAGEEFGPIDAFIHVAGVWHDGNEVLAGKKLHEFSVDQICSTMNVGLTSAIVLTAKLIPFMSENASLVYISGTFQDGGANWLPYYTSKRALEDFVVGLASDESNFKVFGVSPADTATDSYKKFYPDNLANAQSPMVVAKVCTDLIQGKLSSSSGTIVEVRGGQISSGYHR